jgi:hypothetical protein
MPVVGAAAAVALELPKARIAGGTSFSDVAEEGGLGPVPFLATKQLM